MLNLETPILFFDTETTGILKDENWNIISNWKMIQLAYRILENWKKIDKNMFFNTDTEIEIWSIAVHGIYKKLLLEKTAWKYLENDIRTELTNTFIDKIIVAHNVEFDKDILDKSGISYSDKIIDTLKVAKIMWSEWVLLNSKLKEPEYVNLQYLRYFFELYEIIDSNWNLECTTAHDAFWDVVVLERVFYSLFDIIKDKLNIKDDEIIEVMQKMTNKEYTMIKTMRIGKYRGKTFEEVANIDRWYLEWIINADFTYDIKYTCKVWLWIIEDYKFFS
jgi:exodeoxyribonuclease X